MTLIDLLEKRKYLVRGANAHNVEGIRERIEQAKNNYMLCHNKTPTYGNYFLLNYEALKYALEKGKELVMDCIHTQLNAEERDDWHYARNDAISNR